MPLCAALAELRKAARTAASRPTSTQRRTHKQQRVTPLAHRPAAQRAGRPVKGCRALVKGSRAGQGVGRSLTPEGRGTVRRRHRRRAVHLEGHRHRGVAGAQVRKHARRVPAPRRGRVSAALPAQRSVCVGEGTFCGKSMERRARPLAGWAAPRLRRPGNTTAGRAQTRPAERRRCRRCRTSRRPPHSQSRPLRPAHTPALRRATGKGGRDPGCEARTPHQPGDRFEQRAAGVVAVRGTPQLDPGNAGSPLSRVPEPDAGRRVATGHARRPH